MEKEKLIKLAEDLYQSAFDANAYYAIMMQYREMSKKYNDEMNLSPAFYQVVYGALQKACFMEIAKLYDKTKDVVSVGLLLKYCRDNLDLFPEYRDIVTIKEDGREYSFQVPYQHHLKPTEECFYENEVKSQREILKLFDTLDFEKVPVRVNLTFSEFLELYQKRFCSLSKKQENIRVQRNKIYAHNDEKHILAEENVWDKNPVTYPDIQELIDFALDCTRLILGALTGVSRAVSYGNIDDLKNKGEIYKLSPYKLLWCGDYYYVLGYSEKKSKVINFRVDRIASKPEILNKDIIPMPDDFDIENYTNDFMYWVNPIREAFAENDYKKAVEKLIDTYMEQNAYLYQSRVKNSIMILLRQYVNSEREK